MPGVLVIRYSTPLAEDQVPTFPIRHVFVCTPQCFLRRRRSSFNSLLFRLIDHSTTLLLSTVVGLSITAVLRLRHDPAGITHRLDS